MTENKENLVVKSAVLRHARKQSGLLISADITEALSRKVEQLIKDGVQRARANKRKTLKGKDI